MATFLQITSFSMGEYPSQAVEPGQHGVKWHDVTYASIVRVEFLIWCHNFEMMAITSFHPDKCRPPVLYQVLNKQVSVVQVPVQVPVLS